MTNIWKCKQTSGRRRSVNGHPVSFQSIASGSVRVSMACPENTHSQRPKRRHYCAKRFLLKTSFAKCVTMRETSSLDAPSIFAVRRASSITPRANARSADTTITTWFALRLRHRKRYGEEEKANHYVHASPSSAKHNMAWLAAS